MSDPQELENMIDHSNPSVRIAAAELACRRGATDMGLPVLAELIGSQDLRLALEAARAMFNMGKALIILTTGEGIM